MNTRQARKNADRAAWKAYTQACDARFQHTRNEQCPECWDGESRCETWHEMTATVNATRDAWLALG